MLEIIKATYTIKILFDHIFERRKLKIVKYNNSLKNILGLNLIGYIRFSGRYIKYETKDKDKGKEYNSFTDEVIFEGEYKNGERNGKGKEYDKFGKLIFEGEWKSGKRWNVNNDFGKKLQEGKGVLYEYSECKQILYRGEYSNGERNGEGKEYYKWNGDFSHELVFEGEYLNGNRWNGKGYGKNKKLIYELKNGKSTNVVDYFGFESPDIVRYDSEKGFIYQYAYVRNLIFKGEYLNGNIWEGKINNILDQYLLDVKNGKFFWDDDEFTAEYSYGSWNGKGKEYKDNKLVFEGEYLNGNKWNGIGYEIDSNKSYELKNGKGYFIHYFWIESNIIFKGEYINGKPNGKGKEYDDGKLVFEGEYLNGKRNGKGKEYNKEGEIIFEGEYSNGKRVSN